MTEDNMPMENQYENVLAKCGTYSIKIIEQNTELTTKNDLTKCRTYSINCFDKANAYSTKCIYKAQSI